MSGPPRLSRSLLLPGPLAPLSHFGLTLFRHAAGAALRYGLYLLGLPLPEAPPVKFLALRPYLDGQALAELLGEAPGGSEVAAALLDPAGSGALPPEARRLAAAAAFHRLRLTVLPRRLGGGRRRVRTAAGQPRPSGRPTSGAPEALRNGLRRELSRIVRPLGEALLAEIVASLDRRQARARGREAGPCLPVEAWRLRRGREVPLALFGPPDALLPSWAAAPEEAERALAALAAEPLPPPHRLRGRFRLAWRAALDRLAPSFRGLAESAAERGLLASPDDAFFIPFDLAADLALPECPAWLAPAVAANRREYEAALSAPEPADLQHGSPSFAGPAVRFEWPRAPLLPLP